jgi:hypothetical protein
MDLINQEGKYIALYVNIENAQAFRNNVVAANRVFMSNLIIHAKHYLPKD